MRVGYTAEYIENLSPNERKLIIFYYEEDMKEQEKKRKQEEDARGGRGPSIGSAIDPFGGM